MMHLLLVPRVLLYHLTEFLISKHKSVIATYHNKEKHLESIKSLKKSDGILQKTLKAFHHVKYGII